MPLPQALPLHEFSAVLVPFGPITSNVKSFQAALPYPVDGAMQIIKRKQNAKSDINTVNYQIITDNNL
jgi:hypothetical protein